MAEVTEDTAFPSDSSDVTSAQANAITSIAEQLNTDEMTQLDVYEGMTTGVMYAAVEAGYQRAEVTPGGLELSVVESPTEELEPIARIEPDPGETVEDAVDSLTFAGD